MAPWPVAVPRGRWQPRATRPWEAWRKRTSFHDWCRTIAWWVNPALFAGRGLSLKGRRPMGVPVGGKGARSGCPLPTTRRKAVPQGRCEDLWDAWLLIGRACSRPGAVGVNQVVLGKRFCSLWKTSCFQWQNKLNRRAK